MHTVELNKLLTGTDLKRIEIESLEGGIYLAYLREEEQLQPITDHGKPLKAYSLGDMQLKLELVRGATYYLAMQTPYDEMIGNESQADERSLMPLAW